MIVKTVDKTYGIFSSIVLVGDKLICDNNVALPLNVLGNYEIIEDDSQMIYPVAEEPVPSFVYPRQIRLALSRVGLRSAVENYVATGSQDLKDWWEFSNEVYRNNPYVIAAASALGVTDSQLDDLWRLARGL